MDVPNLRLRKFSSFRYKTSRHTKEKIGHDPCRLCGGWVLSCEARGELTIPHCTRCGSQQLIIYIYDEILHSHFWIGRYSICG